MDDLQGRNVNRNSVTIKHLLKNPNEFHNQDISTDSFTNVFLWTLILIICFQYYHHAVIKNNTTYLQRVNDSSPGRDFDSSAFIQQIKRKQSSFWQQRPSFLRTETDSATGIWWSCFGRPSLGGNSFIRETGLQLLLLRGFAMRKCPYKDDYIS